MSITNELRAWAAAWWRVHLSDDGAITINTIDTDEPTRTVKNIIIAMADRIDAMHEHEMTMARGEAIQYLESNASDQYMKRPVDADGVPIHRGDRMEGNGLEFIVDEICFVGEHCEIRDDSGFRYCNPRMFKHVQPDSWERIIHDAMKGTERDGTPKTYDGLEELVERCRRLAHEDE